MNNFGGVDLDFPLDHNGKTCKMCPNNHVKGIRVGQGVIYSGNPFKRVHAQHLSSDFVLLSTSRKIYLVES